MYIIHNNINVHLCILTIEYQCTLIYDNIIGNREKQISQKGIKTMKKIIIGFIAGIALTASVMGVYIHNNMIDMNRVTSIETNDAGVQIILDSGDGYYWER